MINDQAFRDEAKKIEEEFKASRHGSTDIHDWGGYLEGRSIYAAIQLDVSKPSAQTEITNRESFELRSKGGSGFCGM